MKKNQGETSPQIDFKIKKPQATDQQIKKSWTNIIAKINQQGKKNRNGQ